MAMEIVKLDNATLPGIADAIRAKTGGTAPLLPSQMAEAIAGIQTGVTLPALSDPAAVGHVLDGKEYIDGNGAKQTGTLVVCDTVYATENGIGAPGMGVFLELESSADGSLKMLTLPEENLTAENIKSGVSIFGIAGTAKTLRVETGTIIPAEDTTSIQIPCSPNAKYAIIVTTSENKANWDILGAVCNNFDYEGKISKNCFSSYYYSPAIRYSAINARFDDGVNIEEIASTCFYRAGTAYEWTAYYWEDAA